MVKTDNFIFRHKNCWEAQACQNSHMLPYGMFDEFGEAVPHCVQEQKDELIQPQLTLHHGFAQDPIKKRRKFQRFNLSNIFEYTTGEEFSTLAYELLAGATSDVRFVYCLVPRQIQRWKALNQQPCSTPQWSRTCPTKAGFITAV